VIVQAADAVSGSRPGARREAFEKHVKRLTKLEEIASGFHGSRRCRDPGGPRDPRHGHARRGGRPEGRGRFAEEMARKIENELQYPGKIRVATIRGRPRAVDFAK